MLTNQVICDLAGYEEGELEGGDALDLVHPEDRDLARAGMRELHGALLDARLLSEVFLAMTGGQAMLLLSEDEDEAGSAPTAPRLIEREGVELTVIQPTAAEQAAHEACLDRIEQASGASSVWRRLETGVS